MAEIPAEVTVTRPIEGQFPVYPQAEAHTWGAFAFLAIEMGGYGDLEVVNPYNGVRLNAPVMQTGADSGKTLYDALRALVDEMEKADFLNIKARKPNPVRELTADDFGSVLLSQDIDGEPPKWFVGMLASVVTKRVGFVVDEQTALTAWQRFRTSGPRQSADPFGGTDVPDDYDGTRPAVGK